MQTAHAVDDVQYAQLDGQLPQTPATEANPAWQIAQLPLVPLWNKQPVIYVAVTHNPETFKANVPPQIPLEHTAPAVQAVQFVALTKLKPD